jgi:hypothetical protein
LAKTMFLSVCKIFLQLLHNQHNFLHGWDRWERDFITPTSCAVTLQPGFIPGIFISENVLSNMTGLVAISARLPNQ